MKYTEMITLEKLLRTYIEEDISGEIGNVKLNDKIITSMAIIVNRSLDGGKDLEVLIRKQLLKEAMDFIESEIEEGNIEDLKANTRQKIRDSI